MAIQSYYVKVRPTNGGQHSTKKTYEFWTTVYDVTTGNSYLSIQDVPVGVSITNTDYWTLYSVNDARYEYLLGLLKNLKDTTAGSEKVELLEKQLQELIAGSTPEGSEVVDIRNGANGKTYPTAGEAVRDQLKEKANAEDAMSWSDWFDLHRTGWHGGVTYPRASVSETTLGTKTGDNVDVVVEVSTNEIKGRNDFANNPVTDLMFNGIEVNGYVDEEGEPHITAVKGSPNFSRDGSNGDVYMAFLTPFYKRVYSIEVDGWDFADHMLPGFRPWDAAVRPDGTCRSFYFVSKYPGVEGPDGNVASISGKKVIRNVSHNSQIERFKKKGSQYCGMTSLDVAWTQWMMDMKFANRSSTSVMSGCTSYWHQVPAVVEEDNVKRIIIPKTNANKLIVGSCVSIGYGTVINGENKPDRAYANTHAYADDVKILRIEEYDSDNSAVYVDAPEPFSTRQVKLNDTITSPVYLTSMYWQSGACDSVLGCDGSPANPTKQEYPFVLSGVELGHGGYVVIADVIIDGVYDAESDVYTQTPCVVRDSRKIATSVTEDYVRAGYNLPDTNNTGQYIKELGYDARFPWLTLPIAFGASSSTCYGDYMHTGQRANGLREWLWFGNLSSGGGAGLRCAYSYNAVGTAGWYISLRLSSLRCGAATQGVNP